MLLPLLGTGRLRLGEARPLPPLAAGKPVGVGFNPGLPGLGGGVFPRTDAAPGSGVSQPHLSVPLPCAQPHLALEVEDEDSRGGHGGGRRTREEGKERTGATAAWLPSSCGSARAQVSRQVSAP